MAGGEVTPSGPGGLDRRRAAAVLLAGRGDFLLITGLGSPSYDAFAAGDHDANFYLWGAMGSAALLGLGLALAQPRRPVVVLTGDGEQLMGLGGFATIAVKRPENLTVIVLDNGRYGETGSQLSHTGLGVDLHLVAKAAGFAMALDIRDEAGVIGLREELRKTTGGPRYATVRIAPDTPQRALPPRDGVYLKSRLRRHLGFPTT